MDNLENIAERVVVTVVDFLIYIEDKCDNFYNYMFATEAESIEMVQIKLKKD